MKTRKSLILLLVSIVLVVAATVGVVTLVHAADTGVVYVHFYNGSNEYDYDEWSGKKNVTWGSYYWIDTGKVVARQGDDEDFSREVDGVKNVGKLFRINLNASETKAVTQGKKLGLIMVRSYIDELGYLTPYWNNNTGKDLSSDRYLDITLDSNNEYHVWIIAGDKNNYTSLDAAKSAFERIEAANFDDFNTILLQTTKPITTETNISIYNVTDAVNNPDGTLYKSNLHASSLSNGGLNSTLTNLGLENEFDWGADYKVYIQDVSAFMTSANKTRLFLSPKFKNECLPADDQKLGAEYTASKTTFRLWAPLSTNVVVNFYRTGNELDDRLYTAARQMTRGAKGVWTLEMPGNLNGVYYTYTNYVAGEVSETVDVYATAVGVNGNRGMVCNLDNTDPDGWAKDLETATQIRQNNSQVAVIWEAHVRDFSISPDSGLTYKGKYLAFTEKGTTVKGSTAKSGIDYLKELGITYIHLNPVYDFATVDEEYINNTDYTTKQNWGYDPKNYNVPEGSYATDAERGNVRINEFKQMVQALHEAGIGVIMDVVYNHTYTADSYFEKTVPGYYYRQELDNFTGSYGVNAWKTNALGAYNLSDGSGCSNETASEREMYRKYMKDSLKYWAEEYHVDGLRFDLMAIHDVKTINEIRYTLDTLPGGTGILVYGEPWAAGALGMIEDASQNVIPASSDNLNALDSRVAAFNDRMREGIKGDNSGSTGYVQGNMSGLDKVKKGINGLFAQGDGVISTASSHSITYTTSHDNYTLWDQLINTTVKTKSPTVYSERNSIIERKNMLAATLTLTSKGTSFILAGEEMARTKFGNHNSYNAQDKINAIDYGRQEQFSQLFAWYKGLIELRTKRFTSISKGNRQATIGSNADGCLVYTFDKEVDADEYNWVTVILNPFSYAQTFEYSDGCTIIADENGFNFNSNRTTSGGSVTVPAYTVYIIVKK